MLKLNLCHSIKYCDTRNKIIICTWKHLERALYANQIIELSVMKWRCDSEQSYDDLIDSYISLMSYIWASWIIITVKLRLCLKNLSDQLFCNRLKFMTSLKEKNIILKCQISLDCMTVYSCTIVFGWYSHGTLRNFLSADINNCLIAGPCLRSMWQRIRNIPKFSLGCSPVSIKTDW